MIRTQAAAQPQTGSARFNHVILTRFNIRFVEDPAAPSIGVDPAWLAERFDLFERYCLPSILAQSEQRFSWIIFFDSATPEPFAERARALAALRPGIFPVFCDRLPLPVVKQTIRDILPEPPEWLLTTRFDNDDGLHVDFVASLQASQRFTRTEFLNCPAGIILQGERAYLQRHPSNAFISLSEPFSDFGTIFSINRHVYASDTHPVRQVDPSPKWLQVVHDSNISNRVRGWRVSLSRAAPGFPPLMELARQSRREAPAEIWKENLIRFPVRAGRDLVVTAARHAARLVGVDLVRKPTPRTNKRLIQS